MDQGRGIDKTNSVVLFGLMVMLCLVAEIHGASTYYVGDSEGWGLVSMPYSDWTKGKSFAAGDTIVFKYPAGMHTVVPVNAASYRSCKVNGADSSRVVNSGDDKFTLKKGANYFICSMQRDCEAGMRIQINTD